MTRRRRGVTLIEMMMVVAIIALMAGITYPSVSAGIDSLRITSASDSIVAFLNAALNRAERRQQVMEIAVSPASLAVRSAEPGYVRRLDMPTGVTIARVLPDILVPPIGDEPRRFYVYPGGVPPRMGVVLRNTRGAQRVVSVDPITGVPRVAQSEEP